MQISIFTAISISKVLSWIRAQEVDNGKIKNQSSIKERFTDSPNVKFDLNSFFHSGRLSHCRVWL